MNPTERTLSLRHGRYFVDGVDVREFSSEEPFLYNGNWYWVVPNFDSVFKSQLQAWLEKGTVTLIPRDVYCAEDSKRPSPASGLYTWFAMHLGKGNSPVSEGPLSPSLTLTQSLVLSEDQKKRLTDVWQRDYIESVLGKFPQSVKDQQLESFRRQLTADVESAHYLFSNQGHLCGHLNLRRLYFDAAESDTISVHFWVDRLVDKTLRKAIHSLLWKQVAGAAWTEDRYCGVAQANERSVRYLLKNGAKPLHLRVRKLKGREQG